MADLIFVHYPTDTDIPVEDFEISAVSDKGVEWIRRMIWGDLDFGIRSVKQANAWVRNRAEFDRLNTQAQADGMECE